MESVIAWIIKTQALLWEKKMENDKCFDLGFSCDVKVSQWAQRESEKNKE